MRYKTSFSDCQVSGGFGEQGKHWEAVSSQQSAISVKTECNGGEMASAEEADKMREGGT